DEGRLLAQSHDTKQQSGSNDGENDRPELKPALFARLFVRLKPHASTVEYNDDSAIHPRWRPAALFGRELLTRSQET
ncbi:MAG TPA: hypothetical protein VJN48_01440, partial [Terriglobales bacterium]|nr:hypothetical protein [Terriglobales bacterium]